MSYCASCGARIFRDASGENTTDPYLGQVIDNTFEVESVLGTGSMGIVYKARHRALDTYVALKILKHDLLSDRVVQARFQREAQAASKLAHPNVIRILHYGKTAMQAPYIAMECLEGMELGVLVPKEFPLDQRRVCSIALQTARALSAAHAANIVHRDLKPANIFIIQRNGQEVVKVLDFGIAKVSDIEGEGLTKEGAMCGTPAFMSPEQVIGKRVTAASDLFSLGSVMYYMLTCKLPFQGENMVDMANSILSTSPVPPNRTRLDSYIDPHLNAICMKALEKDLDKRYHTALEMIADLEKAYDDIPTDSTAIKPRIVVGDKNADVSGTGETQCMIPAYEDDEEGGTVVEMPAMLDDDEEDVMNTAKNGIGGALSAISQAVSEVFMAIQLPESKHPGHDNHLSLKANIENYTPNPPSIPKSSANFPSIPKSSISNIPSIPKSSVSNIPSLPKGSSGNLPSIPKSSISNIPSIPGSSYDNSGDDGYNYNKTSISHEDKTIISSSSMPDPIVEPEEYREKELKKKKRLLLGLVCLITIISIVTIVAMGVRSYVRNGAQEPAKSQPGDVKEMPESEGDKPSVATGSTNDETQPGSELPQGLVDALAKSSADSSITGTAFGVGFKGEEEAEPEDVSEPSDDNSDESWDLGEVAETPESEAKPEPQLPPPPKKIPAQPKPKATDLAKKKASVNATAKSSPKASPPAPSKEVHPKQMVADHDKNVAKTPTIAERIAEAEKYEKSGNRMRACDIYRKLQNYTDMTQAEHIKLQSKLRTCNRIEI